ncbi:FUSC family protein [Mycobacterium barrassiae]|uniref:FUSC family protein n=1 Tax=Mycobacterium barrassiae TaxID=319709 RepID=UPI002265C956|nr:FUSC family protein [Mycobacterium barrassiae]MCV7298717.1 FUSC family protein [Mycobacterium barrassiae]
MTAGSRVIDALRPPSPDVGAVVRSLLGVLAMAALALAVDSGAAAVWAAAAGVVCASIALQDSPGGRVQLVVIVAVQMGAAVFVGALTSAYTVLFIAVVAAWCLGAGMQWALGNNAGLVAAAGTTLLIIAPPVTPSVSAVALPTLLTVAAGFVQAALIAVWPPQRWRTQSDALAWAYRSLAADARRIAADRDSPLEAAQLTWLRDAFADTQATRRPEAYHGGHRLPERLMSALLALRNTEGDERDRVSHMLEDAAVALDAIAENKHNARREAEYALVRVDTAVTALMGPEAAAAQRFSKQLQEAAELRFPDFLQPDVMNPLRTALTEIRKHLAWTSPILRHAVRLSASMMVAVAADRYAPIEYGHWIALTVLFVLRPETAHTYTRCVGRVAGTAGGIIVASLVTTIWQPTGALAAVLAVACLTITFWVIRFGYIAVSVGVAAAVVFLLDINAAVAGATMEDRLFSVVIGGGLAVVAHVVLPDHALTRLRQRAGELLKTEIDYAATVVKAFVHELDHPADAMSAAWQRAFRARAAFEAASGAARMDSRELRHWLRSYRAALNAVTSACTNLEHSLPAQSPASLTPDFVAAVDDYIEALRGAPPNPALPWTVDVAALTAAEKQVREHAASLPGDNSAARVLVSEIATITRSLVGIAPSREPTSAG